MSIRIKPSFCCELENFLHGGGVLVGVLLVITLALNLILPHFLPGTVVFNGGFIPFAVWAFVFGVVAPRPCLRLGAQFGVSRRSALLGNLAAFIVSVLIMAVCCELLGLLMAAFNNGEYFADLYQIIFLDNDSLTIAGVSFGQHLCSILCGACFMLALYCLGLFLTAMFWRLSGLWNLVAAVGIVVFVNVVPWLLSKADFTPALVEWILVSPWNSMLACVLFAAVFAAAAWLLLRRANIRAAGKG